MSCNSSDQVHEGECASATSEGNMSPVHMGLQTFANRSLQLVFSLSLFDLEEPKADTLHLLIVLDRKGHIVGVLLIH